MSDFLTRLVLRGAGVESTARPRRQPGAALFGLIEPDAELADAGSGDRVGSWSETPAVRPTGSRTGRDGVRGDVGAKGHAAGVEGAPPPGPPVPEASDSERPEHEPRRASPGLPRHESLRSTTDGSVVERREPAAATPRPPVPPTLLDSFPALPEPGAPADSADRFGRPDPAHPSEGSPRDAESMAGSRSVQKEREVKPPLTVSDPRVVVTTIAPAVPSTRAHDALPAVPQRALSEEPTVDVTIGTVEIVPPHPEPPPPAPRRARRPDFSALEDARRYVNRRWY